MLNENIAELVGILIGDGYIYRKNNKYQIGFVGNPITDKELFFRIQKILLEEFNKESKLTFRERGLRFVINSKEISNFLVNGLRIPYGEDKCEKVIIPKVFMNDWKLSRKVLRGIMDTDGTVFVSKKPGIEKYPTMEITTVSQKLAIQIKKILDEQGFRVGNIRKSLSKMNKRFAYRVPLYGKNNLKKWLKEIGFSNIYKKNRAQSYIQ